MKGGFLIGVGVGMIAGAYVVAKNNKIAKMIKDSEQQIMQEVKSFMKKGEGNNSSANAECECGEENCICDAYGQNCGCQN